MTLWQKAKHYGLFFCEKILLPVIIPIIVTCLVINYINPPILPQIESNIVINTGVKPSVTSPFRLDLVSDKTPWVTFQIKNEGKGGDEDLLFNISFPENFKIKTMEEHYYPETFKERVTKPNKKQNAFTARFTSFPAECAVEYRFTLDNFVKSAEEVKWAIISKGKNWTKTTKINVKTQTSYNFFSTPAYGEEAVSTNTVIATPSSPIVASDSEIGRSGVLLGGYDPVAMSNGIFRLLQQKGLINPSEAFQIKNMVESSKDGVLFGGVNVLKFCEIIINSLVAKNVLTISQANNIIGKAQKSEGVLIGGYNVIVLQVEVLNALLEKNTIKFEEGQKVIDNSR
ncbi:MAG: hypothetical protein PHU71_06015 [Candidatus Gracilibacteria bacterium]|nr:hypothetical protein [Candidatus Gracilibacteria bacterium]